MRFLLLTIILMGGTWCHAADERLALERDNRLLRAELELAAAHSLYLFFDLTQMEVQIKSSGVVIRRLDVADVRHWGDIAGEAVRTVSGKESETDPQRVILAFGDDDPADFQAWELDQMPQRYRLRLADGTSIWVRPLTGGYLPTNPRKGILHCWERDRFPATWLDGPVDAPCAEIFLSMPAEAAQRLYWSSAEGLPCLIRAPLAETPGQGMPP